MAKIAPIPAESYNLGFIGAGKMAESIARGVVKSGVLPASRIRTAHLGTARRNAFESFGVRVLEQNSQEWAGHNRFIRVMPNTPAAVGVAASVIGLGAAATKDDGELIAKLFGAIGKVWTANEKLFDAVTGLSGSGPAYIYLAIEALADGGVAAGLPRELALGLASQTVLGAASMAVNVGKHPGQLKDDVTSPGGTTIAGVQELEKAGFRGTLMNAVVAAAKRSQELSQS
ncbi:Pyrroline-5-carboxylate reductase [Handroanthus impetiginosus]|uniref:Pyrroline-5-carboxylate reductase n=1 Tax=Handroanthus impetiginosus TaxID=429701 RepID=A0A2G9GYY0_9LAMI|nr:Pyrroline-5-carboxylate reductase [Handroanthus impetiginosus]